MNSASYFIKINVALNLIPCKLTFDRNYGKELRRFGGNKLAMMQAYIQNLLGLFGSEFILQDITEGSTVVLLQASPQAIASGMQVVQESNMKPKLGNITWPVKSIEIQGTQLSESEELKEFLKKFTSSNSVKLSSSFFQQVLVNKSHLETTWIH
jgi:hypothetical protein